MESAILESPISDLTQVPPIAEITLFKSTQSTMQSLQYVPPKNIKANAAPNVSNQLRGFFASTELDRSTPGMSKIPQSGAIDLWGAPSTLLKAREVPCMRILVISRQSRLIKSLNDSIPLHH